VNTKRDALLELAAGAVAGMAGTVPMTLAMDAMHRRLPESQRFPQDPALITHSLSEQAGIDERFDNAHGRRVTLTGHFAYGALMGALYATARHAFPLPSPALQGTCFGLLVWAGSYAGWLPATGLFPAPQERTLERNALGIAAHFVWGVATGLTEARLNPPRT